jgi:hypothetical protein
MKKKAILIFLHFMLGAFLMTGVNSVTGYSDIGILTAMGVSFLCLGAIWIGSTQTTRRASAKVRKEIYDSVVDAGNQMIVDGKEWSKGCRIDPQTCSVIYPS